MSKRKHWEVGEDCAFLEVWEDNAHQLRGQRKNTHVYKEMSAQLAEHGITLSSIDVKTKISNFTAKYRKCKATMGCTGGSPPSWQFYNQVHKIVGAYPSNNMEQLTDESLPSVSAASTEGCASSPPISPAASSSSMFCYPVSPAEQTQDPLSPEPPSAAVSQTGPSAARAASAAVLSPLSQPGTSAARAVNKIDRMMAVYEECGSVFKNTMSELLAVEKERLELEKKRTDHLGTIAESYKNK